MDKNILFQAAKKAVMKLHFGSNQILIVAKKPNATSAF